MDFYVLFNCNEPTVFCSHSRPRSLFCTFFFWSCDSVFFQSAFFPSLLCLFRFQLLWPTLLLSAHYTLKNGVLAHQLHCSGNGTARILLLWNFVLGVAIMQTGPYYPGGFSTAEESSMNSFNILEERLKCSKTQCFRTVSISDNEIVILLVGFFFVFYFLIKDK